MALRIFTLAVLITGATNYALRAADAPAGPAYQLVLRSRYAETIPSRSKDAQTGGGAIVVEQPEPHTIVVTMGGAAVVGSQCHYGSDACMTFELDQELEIMALRQNIKPPRIGMVGRVMGTLQVTAPCKGSKACGTAEQGLATACLTCGETSLLNVNVKPSTVACGQELAVNHRDGPVESAAAVACYKLHASFKFGVTQGKGVFNRQFSVADFDPAPQLDAFWADALRPFRAVPRRDFGYKLVVRVVEDQQADASR